MAKFIIYQGPTTTPPIVKIPDGEFTITLTARGPANSELRLRIPPEFGAQFVTPEGPTRELRVPVTLSSGKKRRLRRRFRICRSTAKLMEAFPIKVGLVEKKANGARITKTCLVGYVAKSGSRTCGDL